jgi:phage FluMu protein Com
LNERLIFTPDGKEIKQWRCDKCGGVIAVTRDGTCIIPDKSKVVLHDTYISVECPECHRMNDWYLNIVCI